MTFYYKFFIFFYLFSEPSQSSKNIVILKLKKLCKTENIVLSASLRDNTQQWKFTVLILRTRGLAEFRVQPRPEVCHIGAGGGPGSGGCVRDCHLQRGIKV